MDRGQFDTLAKLVWAKQSRRAALGVLLGAVVLRHDPAAVLTKRKGRRTGTAKAQRTATAQTAAACYPGTRCTPGRGKNASGCDFAFSTVFQNKDVRGANLSNANFSGADASGADFRGANLSGACFVGADLLDARLGASVNLGGAVFCNTRMPDGSSNNRDCERGTRCCPAERVSGTIPIPDQCTKYLLHGGDTWVTAGFIQCHPDPGLSCKQTFQVIVHGLQFVNTGLDVYHGLLLSHPPRRVVFLGTFSTDASGNGVFATETEVVGACLDFTFIGLTFQGEPWTGPDDALLVSQSPFDNQSCFGFVC